MYEELIFESGEDFRSWLEKNHDKTEGAWLIYGKTDALITLSYDDSLKEALCFGWIDGQIKSIDDIKYKRKFTPRRKKSVWSERNKKLAEALIKQGLMMPSGYDAIAQAKKDGMWDKDKAEPVTDDQVKILIDAIDGAQPALDNFIKMSPSIKRTYTAFYLDARKEETRIRRLNKIIERLNQNLKPM